MNLFGVYLRAIECKHENLVIVRDTFKECQLAINKLIRENKPLGNYEKFRFTIERIL